MPSMRIAGWLKVVRRISVYVMRVSYAFSLWVGLYYVIRVVSVSGQNLPYNYVFGRTYTKAE